MLLILCYMLLVYGLWEVMTYKIVCPSKSARKAVGTYSVKKEKFYITLLLPLSKRICNYIPLTENKLEKLDITLKTVGFDDSAKVYICKAYSQSMFYFFIGIIVYFFYSPTFSILCFAFSILSYKQYMKKPFVKLEEKRKVIEKELARLSSTISNSLYTTKDVITILSNYTQVSSSKELSEELIITISDMKSGNQKEALRKFEGRIGSSKLSEIVRGLMSVVDGEDQSTYFYNKSHELNKEYIEIKKREIEDRPKRLAKATLLTIVSAVAILIYILAYHGIVSGRQLI